MDKKKIIIAVITAAVLILIAVLASCPKKDGAKQPQPAEKDGPAETVAAQATAVPAQIKEQASPVKPAIEFKKTKKADGTEVLEAVKEGKTVFKKEAGTGEEFRVNDGTSDSTLPEAGRDLTGDGIPDIFIELYSEKDSCSNVYSLLSIMKEGVKSITEVRGLAEGVEFKDLDGNGIPELIGTDCTFLDWWAAVGETPEPKVIQSFDGKKYFVNMDLMGSQMDAPPDKKEMQAYINKNRGGFISYVWSYMLDMIYSGYGETAWEFYELVPWDNTWEEQMLGGGKQQPTDKQSYLEAFKEHLSTSVYWEDIKKLNNWEMMDFEM